MVMRSMGGSWEQWEDELTLWRLRAINASLEEVPPLHITGYLIARSLGMPDLSKSKSAGSPVDNSGVENFVAMFGNNGAI